MATNLKDLIDNLNAEDIPSNIFTIEDEDPNVILGKLNEVIAYLEQLQATINSSDSKANEALTKAKQAIADATQALDVANGIDAKATQALTNAVNAVATANTALNASNTALNTANTALGTANTALNSSNSAVETANIADTKATNAINTANNAKNIAEGIDAKATNALTNSNTAINTANSASSTANEAKTTANNALNQVVSGLGTKVYRDSELLTNFDVKPIEQNIANNTTAIKALDDAKVDKVTGKQLSTEDYTTAEKTKLAGLYNYNDAQVKADITALQNGKVDKVAGKQLSTEDFTTALLNKLNSLYNYDDTQVQADLASLQANALALGNRIGTAETNITNLQNVKEQALAKGTNYIKYKSGLIIQWGTSGKASSSGEKTINLNTPMTTTNYLVCGSSNSQYYDVNSYFKPKSTTQITIRTTSSENVNWLVIGY